MGTKLNSEAEQMEPKLEPKDSKLKAKDLIVAGAFAALYIVVMLILVAVVGIVPITYLFAPLFVGIVCGPIFMLFTMKIPKPGAILILSVILSLVMSMGVWYVLVPVVIFGVIAELLAWIGKYKSMRMMTWSYCIFACTTAGPFFGLVFAKAKFLESCVSYYGQEYADKIDALTPNWIILCIVALGIIGGLIGAAFGKRLLKKHFIKAGIV